MRGTLDLELPGDITGRVSGSTIDAALAWLRVNYPIDEDAAIMARIEREEQEEEERLVHRAEELGLYKPQSRRRTEEDGVWGKSALKELREHNEARLLKEQEQKRQEWLQGEQKDREAVQRMVKNDKALQKYDEFAVEEGKNTCIFPRVSNHSGY